MVIPSVVVLAADLPGTPFDQIAWNVPAFFRLASLIALGVCLIEQTMMLSYYHFSVIPVRRRIRDGEILAPPAVWTYAYHILVSLIFLFYAIGTVQNLGRGTRPTLATYVVPFLFAAMTLIVNRFIRYYSANLRREVVRQHRRDTGLPTEERFRR